MEKHLVLVGGGHAHLTTIVNIEKFVQRGHKVTLIGPSAYHYYSGMGPGMLGGFYTPEEIRFHIKMMAESRGATFVQDRVERLDPHSHALHLESGESIGYDVVSFNIGSYVPLPANQGQQNVLTVKPIENLLKGRSAVLDLGNKGGATILMVGGGPAGLEVCGNLTRLVRDNGIPAKIMFVVGRKLLRTFPQKAQHLAMQSLTARGVEVLEGVSVTQMQDGRAVLSNGQEISYDLCFVAVGVRPSPVFQNSDLPVSEDGGLLVNKFLQSSSHPEIFGGGDCISLQARALDKVGVYAVRENPILLHNLMAALEGQELAPFEPQQIYMLIFNLGDDKGLFCRRSWVWGGRKAFVLKNYVDKRFMKKFQE
jgi:NADH dehydrogenase FAD-containing subunit